jgi:hypothetical protein
MKDPTAHVASRRSVLKWTGAGLGVFAFGSLPSFGISPALAADLGAGDIGILNYAYALEQLEAAFYSMVVDSAYGGMKDDEGQILKDIRDHEVAHRDFLKGALGANAIPDLEVDFSAVDFTSRDAVLTTARTFEDLGVSAYNGAGKLLKNVDYLAAAGRIVSVEARHAATIRDLINPQSVAFAGPDVVDKSGLDVVRNPGQVLPKAAPFIKTPVTANQL